MIEPSVYHRCLAVHLHFAQPERRLDKPSHIWQERLVALAIGIMGSGALLALYAWALWGMR